VKNKRLIIIYLMGVLVFLNALSAEKSFAGKLALQNSNTYPIRVVLGPSGRIYVSDAKAGSVFIYNSNLTKLGELKNLDHPLGIAVDSQGYMYVGNNGRDNVEVYGPYGVKKRVIDQGAILMPNDIVLDRNNNLYVVDSLGDTVKVYNSDGEWIRNIGSSGDGDGDLKFPVSLVINFQSSELHVGDQGHMKVQVFDLQGNFLRSYGEHLLDPDDWIGKFKKIQGIEVDGLGRIHVLDSYMHRVQILSADSGQYIDSYGSFGSESGDLNAPLDILITNTLNVVISNMGNKRIDSVNKLTSYSEIECSDDNECPYMYTCQDGNCAVVEMAYDPAVFIAETAQEEPEETTTTTTVQDDTSSPTEPNQNKCAVAQVLGDRNQQKINILRSFRDKRLGQSGKLVRQYYDHSKEISEILSSDSTLSSLFTKLTAEITPQIETGLETDNNIILTKAQYQRTVSVMNGIQSQASPKLSRVISSLIKRVESGNLLKKAGITISE